MKKSLRMLIAIAAFSTFVAPGTVVVADEVGGCDCANECPLAREANAHRTVGSEAVFASKVVRADFVRMVVRNLGTI